MKKQLPTNGIANELVGSSVFFGERTGVEAPTKPDTARQAAQVVGKRPRAIRGSIKPPANQPDSIQPRQPATTVASKYDTLRGPTGGPMPPRHRDTLPPGNLESTQPNNQTPMVAGHLGPTHETDQKTTDADMLGVLRQAVKKLGKEAATHRFTLEEKQQIADIAYTYNRQGIRTSENEITRIAVNWLLQDYEQNNANSVLARMLDSLHG